MIYQLINSDVRARAIEAIKAAPAGWIARITQPTRSLSQNALLHAEIGDIANVKIWCGMTLDVEQWKRLLVAAWMKVKGQEPLYVQALDGEGMEPLYRRTSTLTKEEMSDLIEYVKAWRAMEGNKK
jgi:hypothetical protein